MEVTEQMIQGIDWSLSLSIRIVMAKEHRLGDLKTTNLFFTVWSVDI